MRIHAPRDDPFRIPVYVESESGIFTWSPDFHRRAVLLLRLYRQVSPGLTPRPDLLVSWLADVLLGWRYQDDQGVAGWVELMWLIGNSCRFYVQRDAAEGSRTYRDAQVPAALRRYWPELRSYDLTIPGAHSEYRAHFFQGWLRPHPCSFGEYTFHAYSQI